jgi:hypothetical protein
MYSSIHEITLESLKKHATMIHYFGLGFIQIKLGERYRIHFYTTALPAIISVEEIHNHRYDFTSRVLYGNYCQTLFTITEGTTHLCEDESCNEGVHSGKAPDACGIRRLAQETYVPGSHYTLSHEAFHTVQTTDAITLLDRKPYAKEFAQVIRPINHLKTCPFSKKISEHELWNIVEKILVQAKVEK